MGRASTHGASTAGVVVPPLDFCIPPQRWPSLPIYALRHVACALLKAGLPRRCNRPAEVDLLVSQETPVPGGAAATEGDVRKLDTMQAHDAQTDRLAHATDLAISPLLQHKAQSALVVPRRNALDQAGLGRRGERLGLAVALRHGRDGDPAREPRNLCIRRPRVRAYNVLLALPRAAAEQTVDDAAIAREEDETGAVCVEPPNRVDTVSNARHWAERVDDIIGLALVRRANDASPLPHLEVHKLALCGWLERIEPLPVYNGAVERQYVPAGEPRARVDDRAVDPDSPIRNQLIRLTTAMSGAKCLVDTNALRFKVRTRRCATTSSNVGIGGHCSAWSRRCRKDEGGSCDGVGRSHGNPHVDVHAHEREKKAAAITSLIKARLLK